MRRSSPDPFALDDVCPGSLRIGREQKEVTVPCDVLLLRGSCVANEAMLTGESVPQLKESLCSAVISEPLATVDLGQDATVDAQWRRHVVFGGTAVLLHCEATEADRDRAAKGAPPAVPPAPDRGCLAVVVRTGYSTCQVRAHHSLISQSRLAHLDMSCRAA